MQNKLNKAMKYLFLIIFGLLPMSNAISGTDPTIKNIEISETVDIKVVITNIKSQKGIIRLGLFNSSKTFLNKGEEYKTFDKKPDGETLVFHIKGVKKDDYAVSVYHDLNSDDKCNLSFLLRPSEPVGFSNNVKLRLFKPSFDDCKINVNGNKEITIRLLE